MRAGDCVVIAPGSGHKLINGTERSVLCAAPDISHRTRPTEAERRCADELSRRGATRCCTARHAGDAPKAIGMATEPAIFQTPPGELTSGVATSWRGTRCASRAEGAGRRLPGRRARRGARVLLGFSTRRARKGAASTCRRRAACGASSCFRPTPWVKPTTWNEANHPASRPGIARHRRTLLDMMRHRRSWPTPAVGARHLAMPVWVRKRRGRTSSGKIWALQLIDANSFRNPASCRCCAPRAGEVADLVHERWGRAPTTVEDRVGRNRRRRG